MPSNRFDVSEFQPDSQHSVECATKIMRQRRGMDKQKLHSTDKLPMGLLATNLNAAQRDLQACLRIS